ncbi:hypothetical protein EDC96DRAFT_527467 [Choanephora cucurbitarum]|nr:hypothetical protein EDC96DRAFT_528292 [Choanephora cucurbitarum]KAI8331128.1 hypothetical protein EDC96DRAFT_527467 [Choanephora cucurbitarum]
MLLLRTLWLCSMINLGFQETIYFLAKLGIICIRIISCYVNRCRIIPDDRNFCFITTSFCDSKVSFSSTTTKCGILQ